MQTTRLSDVVEAWFAALADARLRAHLNEDTDHARSWRESYDAHQPYDPQRPNRVPTFAIHAQSVHRIRVFLVAVRNVLRAQERLPADLRPAMTDQRLLHLTRNIAEHWDEVGGWSAEAFASEYPDRTLGQISATNKEVFVSDVPLTRVIAWLARVNRALTQAIENAGDALPTDDASMVSGGDDLPWPPERRRERLPCPSAAWRAFLAVGLRGDHLLAYASRAPQSDECANEHWRDTAEGCGQTCRR